MSAITRLICTECGTGNLWTPTGIYATCDDCELTLDVAQDIAPYADDATLSTDGAGYLVAVTA